MTRRVVLLRHGRTAHNADGRIQGQLDVGLDELGRVQADALGTVFAADPPTVVVSSDLSRALDTARAVCDHVGLPLVVDPRLRETHFGRWQGMTGDEVALQWPDEYAAWRRWEGSPVEGETPAEVATRALPALEEHLPGSGVLLLVTHGGTARALVGAATGLPPEHWWRLAPLGNTCWSTLVEGERGWRLERHNTGLGPLVGPPTGATARAADEDAAGF
ncbi:MAG: histidine phosphatase family protein [Mycobacteriales bacterium]|nr:histidine phosphatase family protein [Mycobacteriales bacterium]